MKMQDSSVSSALEGLPRSAPLDGLAAALARVTSTTRHLFAADGAGIMLVDDDDALTYVQSDDEDARRLESAQRETGQGPCVDCLVLDHIVETTDVQDDSRWPTLGPLLQGSGVRAVLGVPIRIGGGAVGSLNVYRSAVGPWDDSEVVAIRSFAGVVEDLVGSALLARSQEALAEQLQHALDHRKIIERAIGFVMARDSLDAVAAFDRLRRVARDERRKVVDVAAELLGGGIGR
jgi:GAF domain-containing protein